MSNEIRVDEKAVIQALQTVQEPELGKDLVTLDMVRDLKVNSGHVEMTIMLTVRIRGVRQSCL